LHPVINVQPLSVTVCEGATVDYSVVATGDGRTYQWEESTDGGLNYLPIAEAGIYSGTQTAMLTITGVNAGMNGNRYRVVITGQCPPVVTSSNVALTVNVSPVVTQDPIDAEICERFQYFIYC
jgi:hypothetical protein